MDLKEVIKSWSSWNTFDIKIDCVIVTTSNSKTLVTLENVLFQNKIMMSSKPAPFVRQSTVTFKGMVESCTVLAFLVSKCGLELCVVVQSTLSNTDWHYVSILQRCLSCRGSN